MTEVKEELTDTRKEAMSNKLFKEKLKCKKKTNKVMKLSKNLNNKMSKKRSTKMEKARR